MAKHWYNTLSLSGEELKMENGRAKFQGDLILAVFKANPGALITPSMMLEIFKKKYLLHPPITSIRRAITNLTKDGLLEKTESMKTGLYHLPEHCWRLASENLYGAGKESAGDIASKMIDGNKRQIVIVFEP